MTLELAKRQVIYAIAKAMDKYDTTMASFDWNSYENDADIPHFQHDNCLYKILSIHYPDLENWSVDVSCICKELGFSIKVKSVNASYRLTTLENLFYDVWNSIWDGESEDEDGSQSLIEWSNEYLEIYGETI